MIATRGWLLGAIGCGLLAAGAGAVELIADGRVVNTFSDDGSTTTTPDPPFSPFSVSYQNSSVSESLFTGSGSGYGESDFFYFIAESTFDVTFSAPVPTAIDLSGSLAANAGDFGYAAVRVELYSGAAVIFSASLSADFEPTDDVFAFADTLAPGTYRLVLDTDITPGGYDTTGDWSFTASFSPAGGLDSDADGVPDTSDNCTELANPRQIDSDGDGIGNQCDADLAGGDCLINFDDLLQMKLSFFASPSDGNWNAAADLAGDAGDGGPDDIVNFADLARMQTRFFGAPGPSATGCN